MMDGDRLDIVRPLIHRIDQPDIAMSAQPENIGHILADQIVDDHLTAVEFVAVRHENIPLLL